jgi:hypothetical protein
MTKNWELFAEDPRGSSIPNLGVAKVGEENNEAAIKTLKYELSSFVCDGAYENGLYLILDSYLKNVGSQQPAAWVSGFYGSGKSHLVKVLEHLWTNTQLPDGATPRGLVQGLDKIQPLLVELDTIARRNGGLLAAAGSLLNGPKDVNTAFAQILLRAANLPTDIAAAKCLLWMREEGIHDAVMEYVVEEGREWDFALANMYVSELAEGILAAKPGWASSADKARESLQIQFPPTETISLPKLLALVEEVLESVSNNPGKIPATLVVLDEMQAFIDEDAGRAGEVQGLIEACSSRFGGLLLVAATGQSDLGATATLQKLIDRFAVRQQLSDADVDHVIRQVVLRKRSDRVAELNQVLDSNAGEIDRELGGANIAPTAADTADLAADYPVLPSRRRFWEKALQAVDRGGRAGQLRTQLKVVHEAVRRVADDEIGTVVTADFLYDQQKEGMITTGVLLREVSDLITAERKNGAEGELRSRILSLVFLISRLSREGFSDTGVRSTPDHIADLLVDDLAASGQDLRKRVPVLLNALTAESKLSVVDGEFVLQSKTGQEWNQDYKSRVTAYKADLARVSTDRDTLVREELQRVMPGSFQQGISKTSRALNIQFGSNEPASADVVPIWVRTGWDTSEADFNSSASASATTSPIVYVFVPKPAGDDLVSALSSKAAASETINQRPNPTTSEGQEAKKSIQSILSSAEAAIKRLSSELAQSAVVRQAGGTPVNAGSLAQAIESAVKKSLDRLYPKFSIADSATWHLVFSQAVAGKPDALAAVGYSGDVAENVICKEVLASIPAAGASGNDIRTKLLSAPYGWPRDAIDGASAILLVAGSVNAQLNGTDIAPSDLKSTSIGKTIFRREAVTLDMATRLRARGVLTALGIDFTQNEEAPACSLLSSTLDATLRSAGGNAPLPAPMNTHLIDEMKSKSGAELIQFVALHDGEIKELSQRAKALAARKDKALAAYNAASALVGYLPSGEVDLRDQLAAVAAQRNVLDTPDPVGPIAAAATEILRELVSAKYSQYASAVEVAVEGLLSYEGWNSLTDSQRSAIIDETKLVAQDVPKLGNAEQVISAIASRPFHSWDDLFTALPTRVLQAQDRAIKLLEPEAVKVGLPNATLKSTEDIDVYVENTRKVLAAALDQHKLIVV